MTGNQRKPDFLYLDGIRGLSALWVVLFHAMLFTGMAGAVETGLPVVHALSRYGYLGVAVFIVLSGYVLMLPVARRGDGRLSRGVRHFVWRRARRILPPYWAALALSVALIASVPVMQEPSGTRWDDKIPVSWGAVLSHVALVHDLSPEWVTKINGPMWSVAVEWQIYFAMPLLLLPLWRLLGAWLATGAAVALSLVPHVVGVADAIHPWFLGLFAVGMLAAHVTVRGDVDPRGWFAGVAVATVALLVVAPGWADAHYWWSELLVGASTALGIVCLARVPDGRVVAVLRSRPMLGLGMMSYSLYLVHSPLLALGNLLLLPVGLSLGWLYAAMLLVVVPASVAVAYVFHRLVERRFMTHHQQRVEATASEGAAVRG